MPLTAHLQLATPTFKTADESSDATAGPALPASGAPTHHLPATTRSSLPRNRLHPVLNSGQRIKHLASHSGRVAAGDGTSLFYEVYEAEGPGAQAAPREQQGPNKVANVIMIMGFAAGRDGWLPVINHWLDEAHHSAQLHHLHARFCVFDNRGIGDSDSPQHRSAYSTAIMAQDVLAIMDHLGWQRAHVVGFSMGGMVSLKLAAAAPQRVITLTVLSVTGGGWQIIPLKWRALKLLLWAAVATSPHQRAHVDVHFHYCTDTLHRQHPEPATGFERIEHSLIEEYVRTSESCSAQTAEGHRGQLHAVWMHALSHQEVETLRSSGITIKFAHGYHDNLAMAHYGEKQARLVRGTFILVNGGHFITRECAPEVCMHLADSIAAAGEDGGGW